MKTAPTALVTLLATQRTYWMADLYTFTLVDGSLVRYTSADVDVTESGRLFSSAGPLLSRGTTKLQRGIQVDTLDITVNARSTDLLGGTAWLPAVANGALDGAQVQLERVFASAPGVAAAGAVLLFTGQITETQVGSTTAKLTVSSDLILLNIQMPHNLYQPGCINSVYDTGCTASRATFARYGTVTGGTQSSVNSDLTSQADGYFALGEIIFTSGLNSGVKRTIKTSSAGVLGLSYPLPKATAIGDTFTAYPGCDKRDTTCSGTFNNIANFRAFPYIPVPEVAY
jgi:uncharacterized phage protein (TIGR02218 family)